MRELALYKNIMLLGSGIDACIQKKLTAPALILIYSGIDTAGWLDSSEDYATRTSFMDWVDAYLLKAKPLQCTAMDLYAARCGLLHTFTPDSKLTSAIPGTGLKSVLASRSLETFRKVRGSISRHFTVLPNIFLE